ncbi:acyltransferase [Bradyrhizobium sp. RT9a]|uniref:acyltransferase family protein n=1 Tax=Bradyrhizobium sp. RT9a TaxID=3156384 RepID=UPI003397C9AE
MIEIRSLTGLRGLAALWVVALHYTAGAGWTGTDFWFRLAASGMEGVIIFFLLSGFILNHVYGASALRAYIPFLWTRFARVYPLHFATLIAFGIIARHYEQIHPDDGIYTFLLNVFLVQAWGFVDHLSWNALSWTISIELLCYLLFPFAAYWLARRSILFCAAIVGICLTAIAYVPYEHLLQALGLVRGVQPLAYGFYIFHFSWLFFAGMALQRVTSELHTTVTDQRVFDASLAIGLAIVVYKGSHPPVFDWSIAAGAGLMIIGLANGKGLGAVLFGNPVVFFLGEISYALYLTHGMVHMVFSQSFPRAPIYVVAAVAIMIAAPIYYLFERPARKLLRNLVVRDYAPEVTLRLVADENYPLPRAARQD